MSEIKDSIPDHVVHLLVSLEKAGYEAYVVGGAIRDFYLGKVPDDFDIATSALPEQVISVFENTETKVVPNGERFGNVTVYTEDSHVDITTLREEGPYTDGRHPDWVKLGATLFDDMERRDSTMNALAFSYTKDIVFDLVDGVDDARAKVVRAVGKASDRITEDPLRMLRYVRQSLQHNMRIDSRLYGAITLYSSEIKRVSAERVKAELEKIIMLPYPSKGLELLTETGLLFHIFPEFLAIARLGQASKWHFKDVLGHTFDVVDHVPARLELRFAALFHDIGKATTFTVDEDGEGHFYNHHKDGADVTREVLIRSKFSHKFADDVAKLVYDHMFKNPRCREGGIKKLVTRLTDSEDVDVRLARVQDLKELTIADVVSHAPIRFESQLREVFEVFDKVNEAIVKVEPMKVTDLDITGNDLMEIGFKQGPEIGRVKNLLLEQVLVTPEMNNKTNLSNAAYLEFHKTRVL